MDDAERRALLALTAQCPRYRFWIETRHQAQPRYVAQRVPDADVHPWAVVTPDLAELYAALRARQTSL
jgi:hypothetical protein